MPGSGTEAEAEVRFLAPKLLEKFCNDKAFFLCEYTWQPPPEQFVLIRRQPLAERQPVNGNQLVEDGIVIDVDCPFDNHRAAL